MKARYAACGSWQRDPAKRSCSCRFSASSSCFTLAFYQCSRPTRACSGRRFASSEIVRFSALVSATMWLPFIGGGAAKAQPVSPQFIKLLPNRVPIWRYTAKQLTKQGSDSVAESELETDLDAKTACTTHSVLRDCISSMLNYDWCALPWNLRRRLARSDHPGGPTWRCYVRSHLLAVLATDHVILRR